MAELHRRLGVLGLVRTEGPPDRYDDQTVALVEAFQRSRGLALTGVLDGPTATRLAEAQWRLGERLLYLTRPHQRGDDVAALQVALAQLGFNPGRIDGVFGPLAHEALSEFQRNCGLEPTGVLTVATYHELVRLRSPGPARSLVTEAWTRAGLDVPHQVSVLVCGDGPLAEALADSWAGTTGVHVRLGVRAEAAVEVANDLDVALVLSIEPGSGVTGVRLHYWAGPTAHSRTGEAVASSLASALSTIDGGPRIEVIGLALAILTGTRMTTLHVEHGDLTPEVVHRVVTALRTSATHLFHSELA
ncbi:MAG: peptidoglycan-binding protein [Acidimicrobiales bacterium]